MEDKTIFEKIKDFISKYSIFILIILIIIVLIILLLPNNKREINSSLFTLTLKGSKTMTILQGDLYQEPGYTAYDSKEGNLNSKVTIIGDVNPNVIGTYVIRYRVFNKDGRMAEALRTVEVIDKLKNLEISIDYSPKTLTNKDVTIDLTISGSNLDFVLDEEGKVYKSNQVLYTATKNEVYTFSIKQKDGKVIEKTIEIKNIDKIKPTGSCKNYFTLDKTKIEVTAKDENGISNYKYEFNSKKIDSTSNSYIAKEIAKNVNVTIYDKAGNFETLKCTSVDDSWPVIADQNYQTHSAKHYDGSLKYNGMNYILYYPDDLNLNKKNPLVVFLHGFGEFGTDILLTLKTSAFTNNMRQGKFQQNAIFLAPQCNSRNNKWVECFDNLKNLINKIVTDYNVDTKKISMTGHSYGGAAVFDFIVQYPGFLSAAAPLAPSVINQDYTKMKDLKIAVFTGTEDGLYSKNQEGTTYLINQGVNLKFFPLQGITHSSQKALYNGTNVIDWLIYQTRW